MQKRKQLNIDQFEFPTKFFIHETSFEMYIESFCQIAKEKDRCDTNYRERKDIRTLKFTNRQTMKRISDSIKSFFIRIDHSFDRD